MHAVKFIDYVRNVAWNKSLLATIALSTLADDEVSKVSISEIYNLEDMDRAVALGFLAWYSGERSRGGGYMLSDRTIEDLRGYLSVGN